MSVQSLHQLKQVVGYSASCRSIGTDLQKLFLAPPAIRLNTRSLDVLEIRSRSNLSGKHSTLMSFLDNITSALIGASLGKSPRSDNFYFFEPVCSSKSSGRTCKTMGIDCGGAYDEDDQPCLTRVNDVCDVETAGWNRFSRVFSKPHFLSR